LLVRASALVWGGHYTEADKLSALAAKVEGFHPLWKNDTPGYSWENEFGPQRRGAFGGQL
jgi:hypothetical protein